MNSFNHKSALLIFAVLVSPHARGDGVDLLANNGAAWQAPVKEGWNFSAGELAGSTAVFDGAKTDPDASVFLVSKDTYSGDISVRLDVTFKKGRYLGVYLDFSQETQSGIWMATGHSLEAGAPGNDIERAYIKTVDNGFWIVRATGDLEIEQGKMTSLNFERKGDVYSVWNDDRLIATYYKEGGYPAGPLQLRLTNASATIHRLEVRDGKSE